MSTAITIRDNSLINPMICSTFNHPLFSPEAYRRMLSCT
jgi:hypothetical protein